jgi:hypothetical protein
MPRRLIEQSNNGALRVIRRMAATYMDADYQRIDPVQNPEEECDA